MEAETVPGLQSVSGPGTHTQSPVWGSQEWFGGHEQVWAQLGPNVPVGHTTKTDIWQMIKTWSVEKTESGSIQKHTFNKECISTSHPGNLDTGSLRWNNCDINLEMMVTEKAWFLNTKMCAVMKKNIWRHFQNKTLILRSDAGTHMRSSLIRPTLVGRDRCHLRDDTSHCWCTCTRCHTAFRSDRWGRLDKIRELASSTCNTKYVHACCVRN